MWHRTIHVYLHIFVSRSRVGLTDKSRVSTSIFSLNSFGIFIVARLSPRIYACWPDSTRRVLLILTSVAKNPWLLVVLSWPYRALFCVRCLPRISLLNSTIIVTIQILLNTSDTLMKKSSRYYELTYSKQSTENSML